MMPAASAPCAGTVHGGPSPIGRTGVAVRGLCVRAGDVSLLGPVGFDVAAGGTLVIMGETGAGKSLIAQAILGTLPTALSAQGTIALDGHRVDGLAFAERAALWGRRIAALPQGAADGHMRIDGYTAPVDLRVRVTIERDRILTDWAGTSGLDPKGINVPLVYTKAYACYALKCAVAPEIPNNAASLAPFEITAPQDCIVNARAPAPVALRHVIGHMVPDTVYDALDRLIPGLVPAEGAGCLCNFQMSLRPRTDAPAPPDAVRAEVLTFNSGGSGARPGLDGMNATAFPSGVMTMPVEATEQAGPVLIWRKELRPDSGGAGRFRGGLGQVMEVGAREGHEFDFSAMFDRVDHPARGRRGGADGAPTTIARDDGAPMRSKGRQTVPHGAVVRMAFPGGAGYGDPACRDPEAVRRDLAMGYVSPARAARDHGLGEAEVARILAAASRGELP